MPESCYTWTYICILFLNSCFNIYRVLSETNLCNAFLRHHRTGLDDHMKLLTTGMWFAIVRASDRRSFESENPGTFRPNGHHHRVRSPRIRGVGSLFALYLLYFAGLRIGLAGEDDRSPSSGAVSGEDPLTACVEFSCNLIGLRVNTGSHVLTVFENSIYTRCNTYNPLNPFLW